MLAPYTPRADAYYDLDLDPGPYSTSTLIPNQDPLLVPCTLNPINPKPETLNPDP